MKRAARVVCSAFRILSSGASRHHSLACLLGRGPDVASDPCNQDDRFQVRGYWPTLSTWRGGGFGALSRGKCRRGRELEPAGHPHVVPTRRRLSAHNSHIGDASKTAMGIMRKELNIGQFCRERFGKDAALIGFGSHTCAGRSPGNG